ncbi:DNA/RNA non-specific endonuclease [Tenacibaculum ovolyticum]|uniref:DNA/RNA non-specific endonuclease n=1 Tax=Tenacibaculum ovolyticum TaxID=104270 RepID=UPI00040BB8C9|nr:DNA/RNA non-specific endonuclease [Tenacibaculum ovolyticum]
MKLIIKNIFICGLLTLLGCRKVIKTAIKEISENSIEKEVKVISKETVKNIFPKVIKSKEQHIIKLGFDTEVTKKNVLKVFSKDNNLLAEIRGNIVTSTPGYNRKSMNKFLDQRNLLPNSIYKIENFIYKTDKFGRVTEASTSVFPKSIMKKPRSSYRQSKGNYEKNGILDVDDGGHLFANQLGGISEIINIVPQNKILNRRAWKIQENFILENKRFIKNYKINLLYNSSGAKRPKEMIMSYEFKGEKITKVFKNENRILKIE